jgi:hypothetical protein
MYISIGWMLRSHGVLIHSFLVIFTGKCLMLRINISLTVCVFGEYEYHVHSLDVMWCCCDVPSMKNINIGFICFGVETTGELLLAGQQISEFHKRLGIS